MNKESKLEIRFATQPPIEVAVKDCSKETIAFLERDTVKEIGILYLAAMIADYAHTGQYRKMGRDKGKNYIIHPIRVAESFDSHLDSAERVILQAVALLHDVVEDSEENGRKICTYDLKENPISLTIIDAIDLLTSRENETYYEFIMRVVKSQNKYAFLVKMADIRDNLRDMGNKKSSMADKYRLALHILEKEYKKL